MLPFSFTALEHCCMHTNGLINLSVGASCSPACHEIYHPRLHWKPGDRQEVTASRHFHPQETQEPKQGHG